MMEQCIIRPTITTDALTMRLRVLTFLVFLSSVSATRNWFSGFQNKARKPTSLPRCIPFVGGHSCSRTSITSSQTVLNQQEHQEQLLLSLRAGYHDQHWKDVQDASAEQVEEDEDSYSCHPPSIALEEMAMALRWTGELNRRMIASTTTAKDTSSNSIMSSPPYSSMLVDVRGGEMAMTAEQQRQLSKDESLTIFHAKTPFKGGQDANHPRRRGALRWGPDLEAYLEHLVEQVFELTGETRSLALSLAMIYMDRATSVETSRQHTGMQGGGGAGGGAGTPSCPFCTPRTVHRLILTSLYLAVQAILQQKLAMSGNLMTTEEQQGLLPPLVLPSHGWCLFYETKLASLGIPQEEMHHMIEWMKTALGDAGFFVTSDHMKEWRRTWERSWFTTTPAKMSIKNYGGLQKEAAPEVQQEQRAASPAAAEAAFVPHHYHYDSSLPEASTQQQHYVERPVATVNHRYDDSMPKVSPQRPIPPPPPPPRREHADGPRRPVATTAF